jgi:drug/metabolite transporter (DMT)-like permease
MALIWGGTWAAVKVGVTAVPPIFFAFLRQALVWGFLPLWSAEWLQPRTVKLFQELVVGAVNLLWPAAD